MMIRRIQMFFSSKTKDFFCSDVNDRLQTARYAVRGEVPIAAGLIRKEISQNPTTHKYSFQNTISCNIGNPQQFGQKPYTFNRQFLSCLLDPSREKYLEWDLNNYAKDTSLTDQQRLQHQHTLRDAAKRASILLKQIKSVGSYSDSRGITSIRKSVSQFISKEDGVPPPDIDQIFLTSGASQGVHMIFQALIRPSEKDAILVPIPQYPLYSAGVSLYGGALIPYNLSEEIGWQLETNELLQAIGRAKLLDHNPRILVAINPGNPTGAIFSEETVRDIIDIAVKHRMLIIADEVYRANVYKKGAVFHSFRKVLSKMSRQMQEKCELVSLHSTSKGLQGECGLRGGYMHLHNICPKVASEIYKLSSICLCASTVGQSAVDCMVRPPQRGQEHDATVTMYEKETKQLFQSLREKADIVSKTLQNMQNVSCNDVDGAMYAFPTINLSKKAISVAKDMNMEPDLFYCLEALKKTGITLVPGSGFSQKTDTYHFRITTLVNKEDLKKTLKRLEEFNKEFYQTYR